MSDVAPTFYTYLWLRESDGTPYYVGKGHGDRAFTKHKHNGFLPPKSECIITQEWASESEAFEAEKFLITYYGRIDLDTGCLRNLRSGGRFVKTRKKMERPLQDISGQKFGQLTVQRFISKDSKNTLWECLCDCGTMKPISKSNLARTLSCGCLDRQLKRTRRSRLRHGHAGGGGTPTYQSYRAAINRCTNPRYNGWKYYGALGIDFRFKSFEEFFAETWVSPRRQIIKP